MKANIAVVSTTSNCQLSLVSMLQKCANEHPSEIDYHFEQLTTLEQLTHALKSDGDLQAVVLCAPVSSAQIQLVKGLRSELNVFLGQGDVSLSAEEHQLKTEFKLDGVIGISDQPALQVFNTVRFAIDDRRRTPFADALTDYVRASRDSWHTPGHFGGASLSHSQWAKQFYDLVGANVFALDLSVSVAELDSLHEPHSVIAQAKDLAAKAFGSDHTYFATNGSSTANKVILQALVQPGDKLLVDRGSHKSVHHGIIMSGAQPVWLEPTCNLELGLMGPVSKQDIFAAIDANPDAVLIFLTSCTYDGLRYDMKPICDYAHQHGIKVVVDEAWFAHGYFHPKLRPTALESGADYVTQSTHKVLSAFSQASMIHVNDPDFDEHRFQEYFNMHASTSPQYSMLASLDVARMQASMEGFSRLDTALAFASRLRDEINLLANLRVLEPSEIIAPELANDSIGFDPTKLTIDLRRFPLNGSQLQKLLLDKYQIQVEKYTEHTLSLLITIGTTQSKVDRMLAALTEVSIAQEGNLAVVEGVSLPKLPLPTAQFIRPRDALKLAHEDIALYDEEGRVNKLLVGRVSQDLLAPYPPGVPLLTPGEIIGESVLEWLTRWIECDDEAEVHGLAWVNGVAYVRCCKE